jgi:hypothetical protein
MSSKARAGPKVLNSALHFGRTVGSPPGLPGGGITGVFPASGVGARISGSTPEGGQSTPSDFASLSPSASLVCEVVEPSGAMVPRGGTGFVGPQLALDTGAGGAVCGGGVVGLGGACAFAVAVITISAHEKYKQGFIRIRRNGSLPKRFPEFE